MYLELSRISSARPQEWYDNLEVSEEFFYLRTMINSSNYIISGIQERRGHKVFTFCQPLLPNWRVFGFALPTSWLASLSCDKAYQYDPSLFCFPFSPSCVHYGTRNQKIILSEASDRRFAIPGVYASLSFLDWTGMCSGSRVFVIFMSVCFILVFVMYDGYLPLHTKRKQ